jgi:hypothetical protein
MATLSLARGRICGARDHAHRLVDDGAHVLLDFEDEPVCPSTP